jgi:hypothetical protein
LSAFFTTITATNTVLVAHYEQAETLITTLIEIQIAPLKDPRLRATWEAARSVEANVTRSEAERCLERQPCVAQMLGLLVDAPGPCQGMAAADPCA